MENRRRKPEPAKFWLPALFSEGQLYLFDTRLGLADPRPRWKRRGHARASSQRRLAAAKARYRGREISGHGRVAQERRNRFGRRSVLSRSPGQPNGGQSLGRRPAYSCRQTERTCRPIEIDPRRQRDSALGLPVPNAERATVAGKIGPPSRCVGIRTLRHATRACGRAALGTSRAGTKTPSATTSTANRKTTRRRPTAT